MSVLEVDKELSVYEAMVARFDVAAKKLNLDEGLYKYLRTPSPEIIVHIPVFFTTATDSVLANHSLSSSFCTAGLTGALHVSLVRTSPLRGQPTNQRLAYSMSECSEARGCEMPIPRSSGDLHY